MKKYKVCLILILIVGLLAGCAPAGQQPQVAATTMPVWQFTSILCQGTEIAVSRLVTESVSCLHDYSLQVSQMRTIESAKVVFISGAGLEHFMEDALHQADAVVDASAGMPLLPMGHSHEEHEEHDHGDTDPHIWLAPENAKIMSQNICQGLKQQFPEYADTFEKNLQGLLADLDELQKYGEDTLKDLACREMITFHDGFSYFAKAFDLTILESVEEEAGSEASAAELTELIDLVKQKKLPAVFTETNGSDAAAKVIASETGAEIYTLDMAMAGDDYFAAIRSDIDTIKEAMG